MRHLNNGNWADKNYLKKISIQICGFIGLLSLVNCSNSGVPEHERECQWHGSPSWYCRHTAKVDTYYTKGSTKLYFIPSYNNVKEFPVPNMPVYADESLDQTVRASIVLADYTAALRKTGLLSIIERRGPYTLFAVPNAPMEKPKFFVNGSLMDVQNESYLKRLMGYTIVFGSYSPEYLKKLVLQHNGTYTLTTYYNDPLYISMDDTKQQLIVKNKVGERNKIWVNGIPQANGFIYVTQDLLNVVP